MPPSSFMSSLYFILFQIVRTLYLLIETFPLPAGSCYFCNSRKKQKILLEQNSQRFSEKSGCYFLDGDMFNAANKTSIEIRQYFYLFDQLSG